MEPRPGGVAADPPAPAIALERVVKRYGAATALHACTLTVARGEFVSLLGPSGCGKTTLLRIVGGFVAADGGSVSVQGRRVDGLPPNRRPVNTVFQSYALFPHKTVAQNVAFPLEVAKLPKAERRERVEEMLALMRLERFRDNAATQLSGGQAQRVALARALVGRPQVLLLDEPLAALDLKLRKAMQVELRRIHDQLGTTFVYVTHDQEEALTMSDRIVLMNEGRIVQEGAPQAVYDHPASVFASGFLGEANVLEGEVRAVADDEVQLALGAALVRAPRAGEPRAGGRATLSVRPERIALLGPADRVPDGAVNVLAGVVERTTFLGNLVRALVRLEAGPTLTVELPRDVAVRPAPGAAVHVAWAREAATLLTEEAA